MSDSQERLGNRFWALATPSMPVSKNLGPFAKNWSKCSVVLKTRQIHPSLRFLLSIIRLFMSAAKHWIEYARTWQQTPMAFWVHVHQDADVWCRSESYLPAPPKPIPHKGFVIVCIEVEGTTLRFSSMEQIKECIRVLSLNPLPTTRRLSMLRGTTLGPNRHWLSRLPAKLKSSKSRPVVVAALQAAMRDLGVSWGAASQCFE